MPITMALLKRDPNTGHCNMYINTDLIPSVMWYVCALEVFANYLVVKKIY